MYLTTHAANYTCPECNLVVEVAVVTHVQTAYTPQAKGLFEAFGHMAVLAGKHWVVRCAGSALRRMLPCALTVEDAGPGTKVLCDSAGAVALRHRLAATTSVTPIGVNTTGPGTSSAPGVRVPPRRR